MEKYTLERFLKEAAEKISDGWIIAALTDKYIVDSWPCALTGDIEKSENKVLEIRIFNQSCEMKISRAEMGADLRFRMLSDESEAETFDELQYLDIDDKRLGSGNTVYATGGGAYNLPLESKKDAKLRIRYYIGKYEETGQARIADWRAVEFVEGR
jgi:hypothetical protein